MNKINLERLKEYAFVKDYMDGKRSDSEFIENLKSFLEDSTFRKLTGIMSLTNSEAVEIISLLNQRNQGQTRRGIIKKILFGAASAVYINLRKNYAQASEHSVIYAKKLFEDIRKMNLNAYLTHISKNPNAKIIILIEDVHGREDEKTGWKKEFLELELLRKSFGLNFVSLEGWAGHEVDKERGRMLLNGESILIENLIKDGNYNIVGLEHPQLQVNALEMAMLASYQIVFVRGHSLLRFLNSLETSSTESKIIFGCLEEIEVPKNARGFERSTSIVASARMCFGMHGGHIKPLYVDGSKYVFNYLNLKNDLIYLYGLNDINEKIIWNKFKDLSNKYPGIFKKFFKTGIKDYLNFDYDYNLKNSIVADEEYKYHVLIQRNKYAVSKMLKQMNGQKEKIGIVVFGRSHTSGLIQEFIIQSKEDINIIGIK